MLFADPIPTTAADQRPVITVDDNPMIGEVIGMFISQSPGLRHAGHYLSGEGVVDAVERQGVAVVVLDYEIPGTDTLGLLREIVAACPECRILMLSAHARPDIVEACRRAGASGYALKSDSPADLRGLLRHVAEGGNGFIRSPGML